MPLSKRLLFIGCSLVLGFAIAYMIYTWNHLPELPPEENLIEENQIEEEVLESEV